MQNGQVTSTQSEMSGMLPLRESDPRDVGGYGLVGRLGEGGQGVVFLAVSGEGTRVALKVLPATTDAQVRSRFLKEVAAAQRVPRFCTAQVLDAGIFERRPFIVSEYVDGPSLVEVVEQDGPRGGSALQRIAVATLTALGAVHGAGMVHRDFKPANVLLGPDGPVVIDFGLAAVPGMTTTGLSVQSALGTPAYMAPEQLAGERVTAAADMWSWAVSMTFAGTGKLPFTGDSLTAMAFAILHGEPSVGRLPEPLGSLVRRCLAKDPAARPSARDALSELVAAGAPPMGPLPPHAEAPVPPQAEGPDLPQAEGPDLPQAEGPKRPEAEAPNPPHAEAPDAPQRIAGPSPKRDRVRDKAEHARRSGHARGRRRAAALLASVLLVAGAGGLTLVLSRHGPSPDRSAGGPTASSPELAAGAAARTRAVTWILHEVSRATIVSCDAQVCANLVQRGFPNVETLGPGSTDPLGSTLVVATAAIRAQFGSRLAAVYAPAVIASFGSGNAKIEIRWVYPGGTSAYDAALGPDRQARKAQDAELLNNRNLTVSATARAQLLSGDVDPRLPTLLAPMTHNYPVRIVDFGDRSPGGGPASLLRSMDLATHVGAAHIAARAYIGWMQGLAHAQWAEYLPASSEVIRLPGGQTVLRIEFDAPSPLNS
jgi:serine/threonine protein kinase